MDNWQCQSSEMLVFLWVQHKLGMQNDGSRGCGVDSTRTRPATQQPVSTCVFRLAVLYRVLILPTHNVHTTTGTGRTTLASSRGCGQGGMATWRALRSCGTPTWNSLRAADYHSLRSRTISTSRRAAGVLAGASEVACTERASGRVGNFCFVFMFVFSPAAGGRHLGDLCTFTDLWVLLQHRACVHCGCGCNSASSVT